MSDINIRKWGVGCVVLILFSVAVAVGFGDRLIEPLADSANSMSIRNQLRTPTSNLLSQDPALTGPERVATKLAEADREQERADAAKTSVAQNPQPGRTYQPPPTAKPRNTPGPGKEPCAGDRFFAPTGCWGGKLNDTFVYVKAGALITDTTVGVIQVYTTTLYGTPQLPVRTYIDPEKEGSLYIGYVATPYIILITAHKDRPATTLNFNMETMQWENAVSIPCRIYPLAFHNGTFTGVQSRHEIVHVPFAANGGTDPVGGMTKGLTWLAFERSAYGVANRKSLPIPGEDVSYVNSNDANDSRASVGDWLEGSGALDLSSLSQDSLDFLSTSGFLVPVALWDEASKDGRAMKYHISSFAWIYVSGHSSFPPTDLAVNYWGPAMCSDN